MGSLAGFKRGSRDGFLAEYRGAVCTVRGCYVCGGLVPAPHSVEGGVVEDGGEG